MNWKHKAGLCALLAIVATGSLASAIDTGAAPGISDFSSEPPTLSSVLQEPGENAPKRDTERSYSLKQVDGRVAVYLQGAKTPLLVTDIEMKNLREVDRKLIETGFVIDGQDKLMELLEDLGS